MHRSTVVTCVTNESVVDRAFGVWGKWPRGGRNIELGASGAGRADLNDVLERPTVAERYDLATDTTDLTLRGGRCDADLLLAAGYAAAGNVRGQQALALYRMKATGDRAGLTALLDTSTGWLVGRSRRGGRADLTSKQAQAVAGTVLLWWLEGVCPHCEGRRYELVPGTQITSDNLCHVCAGKGKEPVEHRMRRELQEPAIWLASEFEALMSYILADMGARLKRDVDELVPDTAALAGLEASLLDLRSTAAEAD